MNALSKITFCFLLILNCIILNGQSPSYFTIGEKELSNIEVYSILETDNNQLLIATDNGLFNYQNGVFSSIPAPSIQKGLSLFNLIESKTGEVFCCNLSGQIFELKDSKLSLFFEVPSDHLSSISTMVVDKKGDIIFASKGFYKIANKKMEKLYENETEYSLINSLPNNVIIASTQHKDSLIHLENGLIEFEKLNKSQTNDHFSFPFYQIIQLDGQLIRTYEEGFYNIYENSPFDTLHTVTGEKFHQFSDHEAWGRHPTKGVRLIQMKGDSLQIAGSYFKDKFISAIEQGENGTMYFGTFGQGILIAPNRNIYNHSLNLNSNHINALAVSGTNDVFFAENGIGIKHYKTKEQVIEFDSVSTYKSIFYTPFSDYKINEDFTSLFYVKNVLYNGVYSLQSVKDIHQVNDSVVLFATSSGLKGKNAHQIVDFIDNVGLEYQDLKYFGTRCKSVAFDSLYKSIYVATSTDLMHLNNEGESKEIFFQGESIQCNDLIYQNQSIWCATQNQGILVFNNGKLIKKIDDNDGLIINSIRKIEIHDNLLFAMSLNNFQVINLQSLAIKNLGVGEGVIGCVTDFALSNDKLWMVTDNTNLLSTELDSIPLTMPSLLLVLDSIIVSDINRNIQDLGLLNHYENQLEFHFHLNNFVYQNESQVFYRIKGFNEEWSSADMSDGYVRYNALPSGSYEFECYVQYGNHKSNILNVPFTIKKPFWQTWWFYLVVSIVVITVFFIIFYIRITQIKRRNKIRMDQQIMEKNLIESQLQTLRSQMNPHFIFNSLNSLQELVINQDVDQTYDYISSFASLVRKTLEFSSKEFINLAEELDYLKVYLALEKLRFEDDFTYEVLFDGDNQILVPTLIIQPFIENALQHGLLHKKGKKHLSIKFELKDGQLICEIEDNGVGRTKSQEINERQKLKPDSFSTNAVTDRMNKLSQRYGDSLNYTTEDLVKNGIATGTKVLIFMPIKKTL